MAIAQTMAAFFGDSFASDFVAVGIPRPRLRESPR